MTEQTTKPISICILLGAPLTEQNFERVGIPYLNPHFEIIVFDCLNWLGRNGGEVKCKRVHWQHLVSINTELELDARIAEFRPSYAIDAIGFGEHTSSIQKILAKHGVKFVVPKAGSLPIPGIFSRVKNLLAAKFLIRLEAGENSSASSRVSQSEATRQNGMAVLPAKLLEKFRQLVLDRRRIHPPDICLLAGDKSLDFFTAKSPYKVWIASNDFHQFNKAKRSGMMNEQRKSLGEFLLFIDDAIATANDWKILNIKPPVTASRYYPMLRDFFRYLEIYYGVPVVIAGHPNSQSDESYLSNMGGRKVVFGETASLVLQSSLVLIHGSTATSYAVLARKPTMFFTSHELDGAAYGIHVRTMAKSLGRPLVFMDDIESYPLSDYPMQINERKYLRYETNYLRSARANEEAPWQGFIDFVGDDSKADIPPVRMRE